YNNDLIVATHGRGFWVVDDIAPLRQISDSVLASDAFLFKPSDTTLYDQGSDNGTPLQKDEPQAANPANGAIIDYYLKSNLAGPVTLEVLDASGAVLRTFSSDPAVQAAAQAPAGGGGGGGAGGRGGRGAAGGIPNVSPQLRPAA